MSWKFTKNGHPHLPSPKEMTGTSIQLTSGVDPSTLHTIEHKSAFEAHWILGMWPNLLGDNTIQFKQYLARSNCIAEGVHLSSMGRNEDLVGYRHI
jgi:hypothetical protein